MAKSYNGTSASVSNLWHQWIPTCDQWICPGTTVMAKLCLPSSTVFVIKKTSQLFVLCVETTGPCTTCCSSSHVRMWTFLHESDFFLEKSATTWQRQFVVSKTNASKSMLEQLTRVCLHSKVAVPVVENWFGRSREDSPWKGPGMPSGFVPGRGKLSGPNPRLFRIFLWQAKSGKAQGYTTK